MKDRDFTIESFYERLISEDNDGGDALFSILRQLTGSVDKDQLRGDTPSPLGAWSGWSF